MKCENCGFEWQDETVTVCPSCESPAASNGGEEIYRRGVNAEREGKHKTASRFYAAAADLGVPCAAYAVCRTMEASGAKRDNPDLYEFWLFTAARQDPIATLAYAKYLEKRGDDHGSFRYLHAAADMGHRGAVVRLGRYYMRHGNKPAARYYFERAKGSLMAKFYLFFLGKKMPVCAPETPEEPDSSVESYTIGAYAMTLGLPHIAYAYFEEAAAAAYLPALEKAADMCMRGAGCDRDEEKVRSYLMELGEAGRSEAYVRLGDYFINGSLGGTPDPQIAYSYYLRAAEAGNLSACVTVGDCLFDGNGVDKNTEQALLWYDRAAAGGNVDGEHRAARIRADGIRLAEAGARALAAGDDASALVSYRAAAGLGNVSAICSLGDLYLSGRGVKASPKSAAKRYRRAANRGDARAQYRLACLYLANHGVRYDERVAKQLLEASLAQGHQPALQKLEELKQLEHRRAANKLYSVSCAVYQRGEAAESAKLREAAARLNHPRATFYLACMYDCGDGVPRDRARAAELFERAKMLGFDGRATGHLSRYLHRLPR